MEVNKWETLNGTLLVIDDSRLIGGYIERSFSDENIRVLLAHSGRSGLQKAVDHRPDIILLDIVLPQEDGFEVCRRLKADARTAEIPIIFITAGRDEESIARGFELGAVDYIAKPFRAVELKARVRSHLENQHYRNTLRQVNRVLEKALAENRRLVETDSLTGLYNRRYFTEHLDQLVQVGGVMSLIFSDVDNFKGINDTYGHLAGDYVLCEVADILRESCDTAARVCRWGGEEFTLLLPGVEREHAAGFAQALRRRIKEHRFSYGDSHFSCTMTFSVMQYDYARTKEQNLQALDAALYQGKRSGKNCCIVVE